MSSSEASSASSLMEWIDGVADRFEAAWRTGTPPNLQEFVADANGARRRALCEELAHIDQAYRQQLGQPRSWADYEREFPELGEPKPTPSTATDFVASPEPRPSPQVAAHFPRIPGYEITARLGQGAMGIVYQATQLGLNRPVALKVIRGGAEAGPREFARFRAEAEAAARLQHPNIVQVYEVGEFDGQPFMAMELVQGPTLAHQLNGQPLPPSDAAALSLHLARAIHAAHQAGIIHRDLKPGNILLHKSEIRNPKSETNSNEQNLKSKIPEPPISDLYHSNFEFVSNFGFRISAFVPKVNDFGLAKLLDSALPQTQTGEILGTPNYMAPEQAEGRVRDIGPATDIYALGAILYELLTGRPPFRGATLLDTLEQVRSQEPLSISQVLTEQQRSCPRDLATICHKALAKEPARRYASALAMADDLERFLQGRPIQARPVGNAERLWRWCRRNPMLAGSLATVAVSLIAVAVVGFISATIAREAAEEATRRGQEEHREKLIRQMQLIRSTTRSNGWSARAWALAQKAADIAKDRRLRDEATASLAGIDARLVKRFKDIKAGSVAVAANGEQVLFGGFSDAVGRPVAKAKLWKARNDEWIEATQIGSGRVQFRPDGTPVQLFRGEKGSLLLWDLAKQQKLRDFQFRDAEPDLLWSELAISPDGRWIAAATDPEVRSRVAVWSTNNGEFQFQLPLAASALAFSPAGDVLAAGDANGQITLLAITDRVGESGKVLGKYRNSRMEVEALAFSPNGQRWAAGAADGLVTVWDRALGTPVATCPGAAVVYAVAFSPDGSLLATGGRAQIRLWDAATGNHLLNLEAAEFVTGLAFDASGRHLAVTSERDGAMLWDLEYDRGIQTLRGVASPLAKLTLSPDGRRVAAMGQNWQVGIWDMATGNLLHVLDGPKGYSPDNASFAFDDKSQRFALATGKEAKLWDLATGQTQQWDLPPGLVDLMDFAGDDRLLLFRVETQQGDRPPMSSAPSDKHPRVGRFRNLLAAKPLEPYAEVTQLSRHVYTAIGSGPGNWVVVEGVRQETDRMRHWLMSYDWTTGRELWSRPLEQNPRHTIPFAPEPTGKWFCLSVRPPTGTQILDPRTGREPPSPKIDRSPSVIGPNADLIGFWFAGDPADPERTDRGYGLHRPGDDTPFLIVGIDSNPAFHQALFSRDGNILAWGTTTGTVQLCHLPAIRERLKRIGLGW